MTDDLAFASAAELAALIARRVVSPVEVVEGVLARIEKSQPTLNAFITLCAEEARAAAREAEAAIMRGAAVGRRRGGGGCRARADRHRHRWRRVEPHPGRLLRDCRIQADAGAGAARSDAGRVRQPV